MDSKFNNIPKEKRDAIINAGFKVFCKNSYKKSPMQEIADAAGISKSLLFHYFKNKKELYLFLYDYAIEYSYKQLVDSGAMEITDYFEMCKISAIEKCRILKQYGYLSDFIMRAYYEEEESLQDDLQKRKDNMILKGNGIILDKVDLSKFKEDIDIQMVLKITLWTGDGYLRSKLSGNKLEQRLDLDIIEKECVEIIDIWKKSYYKEEYL